MAGVDGFGDLVAGVTTSVTGGDKVVVVMLGTEVTGVLADGWVAFGANVIEVGEAVLESKVDIVVGSEVCVEQKVATNRITTAKRNHKGTAMMNNRIEVVEGSSMKLKKKKARLVKVAPKHRLTYLSRLDAVVFMSTEQDGQSTQR